MAAEGRIVTVCGLPIDVQEEKLIDKLLIHFLRPRNGGGEITSISIAKATAPSALITFEECEVAQSVIRHRKHIVSVDNKEYEVTVSLHSKGVEPDKIFVKMMVAVDYSQLPQGLALVTHLHQSFPNVDLNFKEQEDQCILTGLYSEVQALVAQILEHLERQTSADFQQTLNHSGATDTETRCPDDRFVGPCLDTDKQRANAGAQHVPVLNPWEPGLAPTTSAYNWRPEKSPERDEQTEVMTEQPPQETCKLSVDTDVFCYVQKHCNQERQHILARDNVEAMDAVTTGRVTTLMPWAKLGGPGLAGEHVGQAHGELGRLYREKEPQPRKERPPQSPCPLYKMRGTQKNEMSKEVKLAATFRAPEGQEKGESEQWSRPSHAVVPEGAQKHPSSHESDSVFCSRPMARGRSLMGDGQAIYTNIVSAEDKKLKVKDEEMQVPLCTTQDILSAPPEGGSPLLALGHTGSAQSIEDPPFMHPQSSKDHTNLSGSKAAQAPALPLTGPRAKSMVRRANSFSGRVRPTHESKDEGVPGKAVTRTRTNSLMASTQNRDTYSAEVLVPKHMWDYMKGAYDTRLKDMMSGLQMTESQSEREVTVLLKGGSQGTTQACQQELMGLVAMVCIDFCVHKLPLTELGVTNRTDETLEMCCAEVCQKFRKIQIQVGDTQLFIIGPKLLCSRVTDALMEVFGSGTKHKKRTDETLVMPTGQPSTGLSAETETHYILSQVTQRERKGPGISGRENKMKKNDYIDRVLNNDKRPVKDPIIKEKIGRRSITQEGKQENYTSPIQAAKTRGHVSMSSIHKMHNTAMDSKGYGLKSKQKNSPAQTEWSSPPGMENPQAEGLTHLSRSDRIQETGLAQGDRAQTRPCGQSVFPVELSPFPESQARGDRGTIGYSERPVSLAQHSSSGMLKASYDIRDGIQGEDQPSPGTPSQMGAFETDHPPSRHSPGFVSGLEHVFSRGLTSTVTPGARVTRSGRIPHVTRTTEDDVGHGNLDSSCMHDLSHILTSLSLEDGTRAAQPQSKPK